MNLIACWVLQKPSFASALNDFILKTHGVIFVLSSVGFKSSEWLELTHAPQTLPKGINHSHFISWFLESGWWKLMKMHRPLEGDFRKSRADITLPPLVINQSLVFKTMRLLFSLADWLLNIITTNTRFLWTNAKITLFITVMVSEVGIRSNRRLNLHAEDPGFEPPSLQVAAWSIDSCPPKTSWNRLYKERQTKPYTCLRVMVKLVKVG